MSTITAQELLAENARTAAEALASAWLELPEEKRGWSPAGNARTADDLVAECALINAYSAHLFTHRTWPLDGTGATLQQKKDEAIALGPDALRQLLLDNAQTLADALRAVPDEDLHQEIAIQWGTQPLLGFLAYPTWNMAYHLGQINYIASMLEEKQ